MSAVASPPMAKAKKPERPSDEVVEKQPDPEDEVRYVGKMTRKQRARFRYFCDKLGADMEKLGVEWIMERLETEMSKRGWRAD
jgi:hypothetical protein